MDTILEIIKVTVPALIVYLTVKTLLTNYFNANLRIEQQKNLQQTQKDKTALKLQALERLIVFLERSNPYQMRMRLEVPEINGKQLATSMVIAINQEFDHNISQQLFVSSILWQIITTAKNQTIEIILKAAADIKVEDDASQLMTKMDQYFSSLSVLPMDSAKLAIRKEYESTPGF